LEQNLEAAMDAMDALRQFGSLPYHPACSWDASSKSGVSSFGIHANIRKLCREAANVMNRYPLKDPLPLENEYIEGTVIVDEFAFSASEDELFSIALRPTNCQMHDICSSR
jgi:hypothetical protein